MSDKYIINNCPCYDVGFCASPHYVSGCSQCTDCVMKQIVEYCLDNEKYGDEYYTNPILKLLDIQEVE